MRKVFSSFDEVVAVWAARTQDEGRSGNGSVFFRGPVIYSYRWSFPCAAMFAAPDGVKFCMVEENHPSQSTAAVIGMAGGAARKAGWETFVIPGISKLVEMLPAKDGGVAGRKFGHALRAAVEVRIEGMLEYVDKNADKSMAQSSRLSDLAAALRLHQDLAGSFGENWPSLGDAESFRVRADMALSVARQVDKDRRSAADKAKRDFDRRKAWEKKHPLAPAVELAQWRRGERMTLQHQQAPEGLAGMAHRVQVSLRMRVRGERFETDQHFSGRKSDFSKMLLYAVHTAAGADYDGEPPRDVFGYAGRHDVYHGNGDFVFGNHIIHFDEMMACAEVSMPRLHAKAVAVMRLAAEQDAGDPEDEDDNQPAGMAP